MNPRLVSIIIPCYCSEQFLDKTVSGIQAAFSGRSDFACQIILVNDGSPDGTSQVIRRICRKDENVLGVDLAHNAGQARAKLTGVRFAKGSEAVFMDDDGQHPEDGIFALLEKIQEGYDLVYAQFPVQKEALWRRLGSRFASLTLDRKGAKPEGIRITSFFAVSRKSLDMLREYHSPSPFIGGYLMSRNVRVAGIPMEHRERKTGKSGYTLKKLIQAWLFQQRSTAAAGPGKPDFSGSSGMHGPSGGSGKSDSSAGSGRHAPAAGSGMHASAAGSGMSDSSAFHAGSGSDSDPLILAVYTRESESQRQP